MTLYPDFYNLIFVWASEFFFMRLCVVVSDKGGQVLVGMMTILICFYYLVDWKAFFVAAVVEVTVVAVFPVVAAVVEAVVVAVFVVAFAVVGPVVAVEQEQVVWQHHHLHLVTIKQLSQD